MGSSGDDDDHAPPGPPPQREFPEIPSLPAFPEVPPDPADDPEAAGGRASLHGAMRHSVLGVAFLATVGLGVAAGYGLDTWLGTLPLLTVLGMFAGAGAGMWHLTRELLGRGPKPK